MTINTFNPLPTGPTPDFKELQISELELENARLRDAIPKEPLASVLRERNEMRGKVAQLKELNDTFSAALEQKDHEYATATEHHLRRLREAESAAKQSGDLWLGATQDFEKCRALIAPLFPNDRNATRWDSIVETVGRLITRLESSEDKLTDARDYIVLIQTQARNGTDVSATCVEALEKTK